MQEFPINAATGRVMLTKYYITTRPKEDSKELVRMAMADPLVIQMMLIFNAANPSEVSFVKGANRHRSAEVSLGLFLYIAREMDIPTVVKAIREQGVSSSDISRIAWTKI